MGEDEEKQQNDDQNYDVTDFYLPYPDYMNYHLSSSQNQPSHQTTNNNNKKKKKKRKQMINEISINSYFGTLQRGVMRTNCVDSLGLILIF